MQLAKMAPTLRGVSPQWYRNISMHKVVRILREGPRNTASVHQHLLERCGISKHLSQHSSVAFGVLATTFLLGSPALDANHNCGPSHQKRSEAHGDRKGKHGIKPVTLKHSHRVFVAQHEGDAARYEAERSDDLGRWAGRQERCRRRDVQRNVSETARKSESHKHASPLTVYHRRQHRRLMMRAHHFAEEHDYQSGQWVRRNAVVPGLLP